MSAQGGAGCRAPTSLRTMSALDYGWWAGRPPATWLDAPSTPSSNHPTLVVGRSGMPTFKYSGSPRRTRSTSPSRGPAARTASARLTVTFGQGGEFAVATLTVGPRLGHSGTGDATPPAALPLDAYVPMSTPSPTPP